MAGQGELFICTVMLSASELWLEGKGRQDMGWQEHLRSYIPVSIEFMFHPCREIGV